MQSNLSESAQIRDIASSRFLEAGTAPAIHKVFRTVKQALEAAFIAGIEVEAVGDLYEILGIAG